MWIECSCCFQLRPPFQQPFTTVYSLILAPAHPSSTAHGKLFPQPMLATSIIIKTCCCWWVKKKRLTNYLVVYTKSDLIIVSSGVHIYIYTFFNSRRNVSNISPTTKVKMDLLGLLGSLPLHTLDQTCQEWPIWKTWCFFHTSISKDKSTNKTNSQKPGRVMSCYIIMYCVNDLSWVMTWPAEMTIT